MEIMNTSVYTGSIKKQHSTGKLLAILGVLSLVGAAFYFSAQPASISSLQSGNILDLFKALGFESITMHMVRKLAHFVLFGTIGAAFTLMLSFKLNGFKLITSSYFLATLMGILDETHQMFVPGRGPGVKDVMIDSAGALVGVLVIYTLISLYKKVKHA